VLPASGRGGVGPQANANIIVAHATRYRDIRM
jgi:hypothetical protein